MGAAAKQAGRAEAPAETRWSAFKHWSGIENPETDSGLDSDSASGPSSRWPTWLPVTLLLGLYGFAVLVYVLLGSRQPLPQVSPDEYQYSALARSFADGNGLTYNGGSVGIRAALYIYSIAPAWLVTESLTQSYAIAKAISAAMVCTVVFPTWLLARRYMPEKIALIPAALVVTGSWMSSTGQLIMENLALPLTAAALAALVITLARPGSRAAWLTLGFAVLATWSRAQVAILVPIIFLALVCDVAAQGSGWRRRLRQHRWLVGLTFVMNAIGGGIVLADPSVLGSYQDLTGYSDVGRGLPLAGRQALAFIAMSAILSSILVIALSARRRAWDEDRLRPLLIVFWVATVSLVLETGILTTTFAGVDWGIQRYVEYSLPIMFVLVVAGIWQGLVLARLVGFAAVIVAAALALTPGIQNIQEQRAMFGLLRRSEQVVGFGPGTTMAVLALVAGASTIVAVRLIRGHSARTVLLTMLVAFTGVVFAVQNQASWAWQINQARIWREGFPADLSWIDDATDRPLARLVAYYNPYRTPQTEFFNRRIIRTYVPATPVGGAPVIGFRCTWSALPNGVMRFDPACGPPPTAFYLNDDVAKFTFYDQRVVAQRRNVGRIVRVDRTVPAKPRLKALVNPPCTVPIPTQNPKTGEINPPSGPCGNGTGGTLYLDDPTTLRVRFRGGQSDQRVEVQQGWDQARRIVNVPARRVTDIRLDVPTGSQQWALAFDWQGSPPAVPALTSVLLKQGGTQTELLY